MRGANRSDATLQLLLEHPSSESISTAASETPSHNTHGYMTSRDAPAPTKTKPDVPSANLISMRTYPSTPDIISMSSPDPDPRQLRRHGTVNQFQPKERNGDIQRYLRNRAGAINHIPTSNRESQPSSPTSSEDEEDGDDDDNASDTSSDAPTLHATWNSDSSRTTTNETVNLSSPNPPCNLPTVDCSPLFTEQERDTVMHFLKRMSANLSGKERKAPIIDRPSSAKSTGAASWDASSDSSDSRSVRQSDRVSVIDTRLESTGESRARVMSGVSVHSSGHQPLVSTHPYDRREDPAHDLIVVGYPGGTGTVKRNKTWAIPRDGKGASEQTWSQLQQRRWMRDANGGSGPPPSRSVLMLQNQSMLDLENIYGDGVYRAIMPDLPRSASLRLSSTTSLHQLEETIRYRHHMESKTSLFSPPPDQFVAFPTMHDSDSDDDVRSQRTQPTSPPLGMRFDNASVRTLSTPFLYRTARTQSQGATTLVSPSELKIRSPDYEPEQNEYGLKSFMDISADPDVDEMDDKTAKKGKLKSFFKKAKAGFRQMLNKGQQIGRTRDSLSYA